MFVSNVKMRPVVCLSVLWLFAAVDGSPVGENSPETNVKLSQGQEVVEKTPQNSDDSLDGNRTRSEDQESIEPQFKQMNPTGQGYVFYDSANGSFKLHHTPAAWRDARLTCYDEGAELASPENEALLMAMSKVLLTSSQPPLHVFTGVNDLYSKGFFSSLRGTPLSRMPAHWAPFEPDNINHDDNCLVMHRSGLLLDSKCDDVYPYMCYKKLASASEHHCGNREYVFYKGTKSCYKFYTETTTFRGAYATCVREGGHLAVANSESEAIFLGQLFPKDWSVAFIGFSYWRKDLWVTVHGETLAEAGYTTWANGEPNDHAGQERCGSLYRDGKLNDITCERMSGYICEKKSDLTWN